MKDTTVQGIAKKYNKTVAQILLRFIIEKGVVAIPKSVNPERIRQNINIFDFALDSSDIKKLESLDRGDNGRLFDFKVFKGWVLVEHEVNDGNYNCFVFSIENHPEYPF